LYGGKMKIVIEQKVKVIWSLWSRVGKGVYFGVYWKLYNSVAALVIV